MPIISGQGGGGGAGTVTSVTAGDASIVIGGTAANPTVFFNAVNRKPAGNVTIPDGYCLVAVTYYTPGGVLTLQGDAVLQIL